MTSNRLRFPGGLDVAGFLSQYWQKKPLLMRAALPGFEPPVSPEELAGLACEELSQSQIVHHDPGRNHWSVQNGPFAETDFTALPDQNWTLLVNDVEKWFEPLKSLQDAFGFLPRWRMDDIMISYATPGGSVGPHKDQYDVFLLQAKGSRRWQLADPEAPAGIKSGEELEILADFEPNEDWVLEPGDVLYLPPGWPHFGVALDNCMTYSIGMRAPSVAELVGQRVESVLETFSETERFSDPNRPQSNNPGEISSWDVEKVRSIIGRVKSELDSGLEQWLGEYLSAYRLPDLSAAVEAPKDWASLLHTLAHGASLMQSPWSRFAYTGDRLFVNGKTFIVAEQQAMQICQGHCLDLHALETMQDEFGVSDLILTLMAEGHYLLAQQ